MKLHHLSIIVSSEAGVEFYKQIGFQEEKRIDRGYDQIGWMSGFGTTLEIFVDPTHPPHVTNPEAYGLRHFCFETENIEAEWERLSLYHPEAIREDTDGKRVFFVKDPDGLPIEIRE